MRGRQLGRPSRPRPSGRQLALLGGATFLAILAAGLLGPTVLQRPAVATLVGNARQWAATPYFRDCRGTSFSEPDQVGGTLKPYWFALSDDRPLAFFAGVHTPWSCVRKIKTGWEDCELYGFLTTDANAEVATYHSKAMPVILTDPADWDRWMSDVPWAAVKHLQQPLPDGSLKVVATGERKDEAVPA